MLAKFQDYPRESSVSGYGTDNKDDRYYENILAIANLG